MTQITEIRSEDDLFGPGAQPGTMPTDLEQATGLERLEILGKMEGVDIFDMRPLDASRLGELPFKSCRATGSRFMVLRTDLGRENVVLIFISIRANGPFRNSRQPHHRLLCW